MTIGEHRTYHINLNIYAGGRTDFSRWKYKPKSGSSILQAVSCRIFGCNLGSVLTGFLPSFPFQIWVSDVTFVTFFGDKKCDASHLSHFWEECDALAHENVFFNL